MQKKTFVGRTWPARHTARQSSRSRQRRSCVWESSNCTSTGTSSSTAMSASLPTASEPATSPTPSAFAGVQVDARTTSARGMPSMSIFVITWSTQPRTY